MDTVTMTSRWPMRDYTNFATWFGYSVAPSSDQIFWRNCTHQSYPSTLVGSRCIVIWGVNIGSLVWRRIYSSMSSDVPHARGSRPNIKDLITFYEVSPSLCGNRNMWVWTLSRACQGPMQTEISFRSLWTNWPSLPTFLWPRPLTQPAS